MKISAKATCPEVTTWPEVTCHPQNALGPGFHWSAQESKTWQLLTVAHSREMALHESPSQLDETCKPYYPYKARL